MDGKTLRGSRIPDGTVHLLAPRNDTQIVVAQRQVEAKSNEIPTFAPLLSELGLTGLVINADALCRLRHKASYEDLRVMPTSCWFS
ncbi:hypothetical protein OHA25_19240 [Nonomuraea sp. NBC_00507]|uniref:hypothetical protein n=1 Tax=Nonomuraea sp. NBC_00507 TaxID=2976002 RepID=UPI002E18FC3E